MRDGRLLAIGFVSRGVGHADRTLIGPFTSAPPGQRHWRQPAAHDHAERREHPCQRCRLRNCGARPDDQAGGLGGLACSSLARIPRLSGKPRSWRICRACCQAPAAARRWLASLLASLGDACQAAGDLPAARQAWQQALQSRNDLGLPDNHQIRAKLEQASPPSPPA